MSSVSTSLLTGILSGAAEASASAQGRAVSSTGAGQFSASRAAAPAVAAPMRIEPPAWPHPGSLDLVSKLLDLAGTELARVNNGTASEPGSDFWAMLNTALPAARRAAAEQQRLASETRAPEPPPQPLPQPNPAAEAARQAATARQTPPPPQASAGADRPASSSDPPPVVRGP